MIAIYKRLGETPLEALDRLRKAKPELSSATLSYAGRLDPMAEGILLVLVGDENNEREKYLHLDKVYEVEILLGIETDTYDILGKITQIQKTENSITSDQINHALRAFIGERELAYPPYSSKAVQGKPLFMWAREGKLHEIEIPKRKVTIHAIDVLCISERKINVILKYVEESIALVKGDFRQTKILATWLENVRDFDKNSVCKVIKVRISASSGTYMRTIAHELGKTLKTGALALSIKRIKIGEIDESATLHLSP